MSDCKVVKSVSSAHDALLAVGVALGMLGLLLVTAGLATADPASPATSSAAQPIPQSASMPMGDQDDPSTCQCGRLLARSYGSSTGWLDSLREDRAASDPTMVAPVALPVDLSREQQDEGRPPALKRAWGFAEKPVAPLRVIVDPSRTVPNERELRAMFMIPVGRRHASGDEPELLVTPAWMDPSVTILAPPR